MPRHDHWPATVPGQQAKPPALDPNKRTVKLLVNDQQVANGGVVLLPKGESMVHVGIQVRSVATHPEETWFRFDLETDPRRSQCLSRSRIAVRSPSISLFFSRTAMRPSPVRGDTMPRLLSVALIAVSILASLTTRMVFAAPGDITLTAPTVVCPKAHVGDEQLQGQYDEMWGRYERAIESETKAVEDELGRLYDSAKFNGNLDLVLFWDGMKKSFAEAGNVRWETAVQKKDWEKRFGGAVFPEDLTTVLRRCEAGYGKARTDLQDGYKALIAELTKKGKVAEAQAIKSEMENIWTRSAEPSPKPESSPPTPKPGSQRPLLQRIAGKWSRFGVGYFYQFNANGTAEIIDRGSNRVTSRVRMTVISAEAVEAVWDSGFRDRFVLAGDDMVAVMNWNPAGKRDGDGFVLERMK